MQKDLLTEFIMKISFNKSLRSVNQTQIAELTVVLEIREQRKRKLD